MAIKLGKKEYTLKNYEAALKDYTNAVKDGADAEKQAEFYATMQNAMVNDMMDVVKQDGIKAAEQKFNELNSYANKGLSAEEIKFFNAVSTEVGYKEETLLPQTTIDKIFEDMVKERPLLAEIGVQTTGLRMRILKADPSGQAVWGKIFGEIKGQLDAAFTEEDITQSKLTAFVVIPNDLLEYGPVWVERFVRNQITEAFAVALEAAYVSGDGNDKPVGLNRQVQADVSISAGVYPEKAVETDVLTFEDSKKTISELGKVISALSVKENGKSASIDGKVVLLVNPTDVTAIKAQNTIQTLNGVFVTALPYNIRIVESEFAKAKQVIAFVNDRYDAYVGGGINVKAFDQTLALEDCMLYTAKQFAYGKAEDDNTAKVFTLTIPAVPVI